MYTLCIYRKTIILSLFKIDTLNFTMYILTILTCPLKTYVIRLHNLISVNIFFTKRSLFFFIIVKRQPKTRSSLIYNTSARHERHECDGVVIITTTQLHSTKPELRCCAGSNPARGVSEIRDVEDLWQWSRLEIRLNTFRRSTIPQ